MFITILLLIASAIIAAASVPFMLKLVPPNPVFGFPTKRALSKPEIWYQVNVFGGRAILAAAVVTAILLMMYSGTLLRSGWLQLATLLVSLAVAVGATLAYERRIA